MLCHGILYISQLHALGTKDLIHNVLTWHTDELSGWFSPLTGIDCPEICRNIQCVFYNSELLSFMNFMHQGFKLIFTYVADQSGVFLSELFKTNEYMISKHPIKSSGSVWISLFLLGAVYLFISLQERSGLICIISYFVVTCS